MLGTMKAWVGAAFAGMLAFGAHAQSSGVVAPLPVLGPYTVGCSNLEQDFSRIPPGEFADAYWVGLPRDGSTPRFVTDLLVDPGHSFVYQQTFPGDSSIFGSFAGRTFPYALLVCYPTDPGVNPGVCFWPAGQNPHLDTGGLGSEVDFYLGPGPNTVTFTNKAV